MTCRCGALLTDGNSAPTCESHGLCVDCFDPADIHCVECAEEYKHMLRDREEERRADADRDERDTR